MGYFCQNYPRMILVLISPRRQDHLQNPAFLEATTWDCVELTVLTQGSHLTFLFFCVVEASNGTNMTAPSDGDHVEPWRGPVLEVGDATTIDSFRVEVLI